LAACRPFSGSDVRLGYFCELFEPGWVAHRKVRQYLAIDTNTALLEPVHELAVAQPILAGGGVDANDPQATKLTLAHAAVAKRVRQPFFDGFTRLAILLATAADVALR